jgi:hypothetical protein
MDEPYLESRSFLVTVGFVLFLLRYELTTPTDTERNLRGKGIVDTDRESDQVEKNQRHCQTNQGLPELDV